MYDTLALVLQKTGISKPGFIKQFASYFVVAGIGWVVDFGVLIVLHDVLHVYYLVAASVAFVVALAVNYGLSSQYVFKNSKMKSRWADFIAFGVIGLVGLGMLNVLMWFFTGLLGVYYLLSKCIATVVVYLWNFFARKALYHD